jgi:uncharacterized membrane protein
MSIDGSLAPDRGYERRDHEQRSRRQETRLLEARIAIILRTGVITAAVFLTAALPWIMLQDRSQRAHRLSVGEALRLLPNLDPRALAAVGVIILVATPILQLLASAFLFWRKRDRLYLGLTLLVCTIVTAGALLTSGGH